MYPIKTFKDNNTIVKVCIEDIKKIVNAVENSLSNIQVDIDDCMSDLFNYKYNGYYLETKGKASCKDDEFNEEVGNEIAFRKVKLYANIKKYKFIKKVLACYIKRMQDLIKLNQRLLKYIEQDINAIREYNPNFDPEF